MRPIDADALEKMFKTQYGCETCDNYGGIRCRACHCDDALGIIDSAPTLDVQPVRRGEWLVCEYEYLDCSECGEAMYTGCNSTKEAMALKDYWKPFCPNCGADMRGVSG